MLFQERLQALKEEFEKSGKKGQIVDAIMASKIAQAEKSDLSDEERDALIRQAEIFLELLSK
jgi:hypothetical protein